MTYKKRERIGHNVNLTPLIDIVFLLLVFFMLTANFIEEKEIEVRLPEAENGAVAQEEKPVVVSITKEGIFIGSSKGW